MEMSDDEIDYSDIPPLDDDLLSGGSLEMPKKSGQPKVVEMQL
jgi:hypothetical protein